MALAVVVSLTSTACASTRQVAGSEDDQGETESCASQHRGGYDRGYQDGFSDGEDGKEGASYQLSYDPPEGYCVYYYNDLYRQGYEDGYENGQASSTNGSSGDDTDAGPDDDTETGPGDDTDAGPGDDTDAGPGDDTDAGPGDGGVTTTCSPCQQGVTRLRLRYTGSQTAHIGVYPSRTSDGAPDGEKLVNREMEPNNEFWVDPLINRTWLPERIYLFVDFNFQARVSANCEVPIGPGTAINGLFEIVKGFTGDGSEPLCPPPPADAR